jgi:regulator of protease activity HflC (stomatin/prohibitin superfamily)
LSLFAFGAVITAVGILIAKGIHSVPDGYQAVVYRLKKFHRSMGPGWFWIIPFIDEVVEVLSVQNQQIEMPNERTPVSDGPELTSKITVVYRLTNPGLAYTRMSNIQDLVKFTARAALREAFGAKTLREVNSKQSEISRDIQELLEQKSSSDTEQVKDDNKIVLWGISIIMVAATDIDIPDELEAALSMEATTERQVAAKRIQAESEVAFAHLYAKANEVYQDNPGARGLRDTNLFYGVIQDQDKIVMYPYDLSGLTTGMSGALAFAAANDPSPNGNGSVRSAPKGLEAPNEIDAPLETSDEEEPQN